MSDNSEDDVYDSREVKQRERNAYSMKNQEKKQIKYIWFIIGIVGVIGILTLFWSAWNLAKQKYQEDLVHTSQKEQEEIIKPTNYDNFAIYSSANDTRVKKLEGKVEEMRKDQQAFQNDLKRDLKETTQRNQEDIQRKIEGMEGQIGKIKDDIQKGISEQIASLKDALEAQRENASSGVAQDSVAIPQEQKMATAKSKPLTFTYVVEKIPSQKQPMIERGDNGMGTLNIPYGIARGITITGGEASVVGFGRQDDLPITIKLIDDLVTASNKIKRTRQCLVGASGVGNMNNERVQVRLTHISCIYEDKAGKLWIARGQVKGYIADENGHAGITGQLISKEGKILQTMLPIALLQTGMEVLTRSVGKTTILPSGGFGSDLSASLLSGVQSGANTTINKITNLYEKYLQAMNPSISIKQGRIVSIIFAGSEKIVLEPYTEGIKNSKDGENGNDSLGVDMGDNEYDYDYFARKIGEK